MNYIAQEHEHLNDKGLPVCDICGGDRFVINPNKPNEVHRALCPCQAREKNAQEKAFVAQQERIKIDQAKTLSLLGKRYANATFQTYKLTSENKTAFKIAVSYAEKHKEMLDKGYGIYVYGNSGSGKTHLMACICNYLLEHGEKCIFTSVSKIMADIRTCFAQNKDTSVVVDKYSRIPFLFIDDLGKDGYKKGQGDFGWLDEQLYVIINDRYNNMLPTLACGNYALEDLVGKEIYDSAVVDRLVAMATKKIRLDGESQRGGDKNV